MYPEKRNIFKTCLLVKIAAQRRVCMEQLPPMNISPNSWENAMSVQHEVEPTKMRNNWWW